MKRSQHFLGAFDLDLLQLSVSVLFSVWVILHSFSMKGSVNIYIENIKFRHKLDQIKNKNKFNPVIIYNRRNDLCKMNIQWVGFDFSYVMYQIIT